MTGQPESIRELPETGDPRTDALPPRGIQADRLSLTLLGPPVPAGSTLSILLEGRPIWNVRTGDAAGCEPGVGCVIGWPPALAGRFSGWAPLTVLKDGSPWGPTTRITFDDSPQQFLLEEPRTGLPQIVNKWGRISRNFQGQRAHLIDEALDEACALVEWMRGCGHEAFVTGGTLLGPVRDGRIMPGDDDVDLAYLSRHQNPSDIALEGFELERALRAEGYETVRHSAGHLQVLFPGTDGTDRFYLDIFTYFVVGGWFHGTFHARERAGRVKIFPLRHLTINGRELPAPAEPEEMLTAIYGPGWRTPDPAFRFSTPPPARRRYDSWLGNLDGDRENWEDYHRALAAQGSPGPSPWAAELALELPGASRILELGCGLGADARHLAAQGHHVVAVDYSRPAVQELRAVLPGPPGSLRAERVNLNSLRQTAPLAKYTKGAGPLYVYARMLLNALGVQGQENTLTLLGHLLRNQYLPAAAFMEFQHQTAEPPFPGSRFHHRVDISTLKASLRGHGLMAEEVPPLPGHLNEAANATCRLKVMACHE